WSSSSRRPAEDESVDNQPSEVRKDESTEPGNEGDCQSAISWSGTNKSYDWRVIGDEGDSRAETNVGARHGMDGPPPV
ncbi:hypothetical protein KXX02_000001, partial [Aspergillus fumigatus]